MSIQTMRQAANEAIYIRLDFPPTNTTHQSGTRQRRGGKGTYKTPELQGLEARYAVALMPHRPAKPLEGPLCLWIDFVFPWRKTEPKKNRLNGSIFKDTIPDLDNMEKTVKDMLKNCGFYYNDSQVANKRTTKWWGDRPGITIQLMKAEKP